MRVQPPSLRKAFSCSSAVAGAVSSYAYDAEGRRVTKTAGGQTTVYVYDAFGQLVAEYGRRLVLGRYT